MQIVALVGSLRKGSYNRMVFEHYQKMVASQVDLVEGRHENFPLYNDDIKDKAFPDSVQQLGELIKSSQGIIFFSPEYNYSVPGPLKNTLDWLSRLPDAPLAGKAATIISASPGRLGGARMQYHLRQIGVFLDLRFLNKPEIMISEVHKKLSPSGELTDAETQKHLQGHFETFMGFIQNGK